MNLPAFLETFPMAKRPYLVATAMVVSVLLGALITGRSYLKSRMSNPVIWGTLPASTVTQGGLPVLGTLPDFSLLERSGDSISRESLLGKIWIANFIFTRCPGPCPNMSQQFARLQRFFRKDSDFALVSMSVDPDYDTIDVLNTYAANYRSDPERWFFVTGEEDVLSPLIKEGFKLPAGESPNLHSTRFVLIDRLGRIRGYYESNLAGSISQLRRDTQRLLRE